MEYRKLPKGGEALSILGIGTGFIGAAGEEEMERTLHLALENGVNFLDLAAGDAAPFPAFGRALEGVREKVYLQVHFGAEYTTGKYGWTTSLERIKRSVDWQLKNLRTDYIDFGFLTAWTRSPTWRRCWRAACWSTSGSCSGKGW